MARKQKQEAPTRTTIEIIQWRDHATIHDGRMDLKLVTQISIGAVMYEDEEQVMLLSTYDPDDNPFTAEQVDAAQILKVAIVWRRVLDTIDWPPESGDKENP